MSIELNRVTLGNNNNDVFYKVFDNNYNLPDYNKYQIMAFNRQEFENKTQNEIINIVRLPATPLKRASCRKLLGYQGEYFAGG